MDKECKKKLWRLTQALNDDDPKRDNNIAIICNGVAKKGKRAADVLAKQYKSISTIEIDTNRAQERIPQPSWESHLDKRLTWKPHIQKINQEAIRRSQIMKKTVWHQVGSKLENTEAGLSRLHQTSHGICITCLEYSSNIQPYIPFQDTESESHDSPWSHQINANVEL
ncbi:hypothetical protein ElyMa_001485400 [Elysia marginata]|uniref:Uncharacterized protein n=1 Tax=Elysia marginata TaxID=1093978 RepID=A0AAV4J3N7_9GAST|nr:hypothetical protein ElyMa_001485400 [Elysia marginata]